MKRQTQTVSADEISHFSRDAMHWWDENGPFAPLHRLNPVRLKFLKQTICDHFDLDRDGFTPFTKLKILDIGCGGGLICEPLTRLGAAMIGADADPVAIDAAKEHAAESGLKIDYQNTPAENLEGQYDVVLALEIVEHVSDLNAFIAECARLVKPGGLVIFSTLNRTPKSFALGIVAAEYILRWVPRGTHSWKKFVKPSELARTIRHNGLKPGNITGMALDPLNGDFNLSDHDIDVNYFMTSTKDKTK